MFDVLLMLVVFFLLIFSKQKVFIALLGSCITYFLLNPEVPNIVIPQRLLSGVSSSALLAIPFFVTAGVLMVNCGIAKRMLDFVGLLVGKYHGGLAQVNVSMSLLMGGMSGSNIADASMMSKILVPQMRRNGYSNEFSSVVTAFSAIITPLIPPGIAMILYGSIANVSIGQLFLSGLGIGVLTTIFLSVVVYFISKKRGYKELRAEPINSKIALSSARAAFLAILLPVLIIGSIRIGLFTPTEAGAAAVVYTVLLGLTYRELTWKKFSESISESVSSTASIMIIIVSATCFSWILTRESIPQSLAEWMMSFISSPIIFLTLINLILLVIGMFMEGNSVMIILIPLFAPMAVNYGIDEIHFAMIFIFNLAIGTLTPPIGTLMLVTASITKVSIPGFIKEAILFYIVMLVLLLLVTYTPVISTGLITLVY